jgi:hypothetical protein
MQCPSCGAEARGKFCSACGASLRATHCAECGAKLVPGARFCNSCGNRVAGTAGSGGKASPAHRTDRSNLPWYIAGGVLLVVLVVLVASMFRGGETPLGGASPLDAPVAPGTPPPLTGTPREMADRLFNRIMEARERGDMATARQFAPMGIQAYEAAEPLDHDGLYHLAIIHVVAGNHEEAVATAERVLSDNPNHLLSLAAAAEALEAAGDSAAARAHHERFLAAYEAEVGRPIQEYMDHARVLPEYREAALRATGR